MYFIPKLVLIFIWISGLMLRSLGYLTVAEMLLHFIAGLLFALVIRFIYIEEGTVKK